MEICRRLVVNFYACILLNGFWSSGHNIFRTNFSVLSDNPDSVLIKHHPGRQASWSSVTSDELQVCLWMELKLPDLTGHPHPIVTVEDDNIATGLQLSMGVRVSVPE